MTDLALGTALSTCVAWSRREPAARALHLAAFVAQCAVCQDGDARDYEARFESFARRVAGLDTRLRPAAAVACFLAALDARLTAGHRHAGLLAAVNRELEAVDRAAAEGLTDAERRKATREGARLWRAMEG